MQTSLCLKPRCRFSSKAHLWTSLISLMMRALHTSLQKIRFCNSGFRIFHTLKDTKPIHPSVQGSLNKWQEKKPGAKLARTHLKPWPWMLPLVLLVFYYWVSFIPSLKIPLTQVFPLRLHFPILMISLDSQWKFLKRIPSKILKLILDFLTHILFAALLSCYTCVWHNTSNIFVALNYVLLTFARAKVKIQIIYTAYTAKINSHSFSSFAMTLNHVYLHFSKKSKNKKIIKNKK